MKKTIIIIEDEPDILEVLTSVLTIYNYEVIPMRQTDDILQLTKEHNPDLILTDYLLFGMDGGSICKAVKSNPETKHIPVVLISAYKNLADAMGNFGFDGYIAKPFAINSLVNTVKSYMNN